MSPNEKKMSNYKTLTFKILNVFTSLKLGIEPGTAAWRANTLATPHPHLYVRTTYITGVIILHKNVGDSTVRE